MMTAMIHSLAHFFAPWQSLYGDSKVVGVAVVTLHLVAMLFGGGYAVAADRAVLRARPATPVDARRILGELHALHVPVVTALVVLTISGTAMAAADVETFAKSPIFAAKLAVVVLLLINGLILLRSEQALGRLIDDGQIVAEVALKRNRTLWGHLRRTAWASAGLWTIAVVIGVMLTDA